MNNEQLIERLIDLAFEEDIATGDITTESIIPESSRAIATMTAKADGVISGIDIVEKVFRRFSEDVAFTPFKNNGDKVTKGEVILKIEASYPTLLMAERTALNFFQRMSGIATETAKYVAELAGTHTQLLDTRKTAPGMRVTDKMAVKDGGGTNHRMGLYDMVMIKDNHIKMAGTIAKAVEQVRSKVPAEIKVEVETTNLVEVQEAIDAKADIIMLDNNNAIFFCDSTLTQFFEENLERVGRDKVKVKRIEFEENILPERKILKINDTVASARLDCVVASLCSLSRERAKEILKASRVELNYNYEERPDKEVVPPAMISVRGVGKFNVISLSDKTKKGRYRLIAEKFL